MLSTSPLHPLDSVLPRNERSCRADAVPPRVRWLGRTDYAVAWEQMRAFTAARSRNTPDELWLTEHTPTYTVGVAGRAQHLPRGDCHIPVVQSDRGGQITYHGPGQVILYLLLDLRRRGLGVRELVRRMENAVSALLGEHDVVAQGDVQAPGVYVGSAKIAAVGLRVRNGCCYHGLALNVAMDLAPFAAIDPCGYPGLAVTQTRTLGIAATPEQLGNALARQMMAQLA